MVSTNNARGMIAVDKIGCKVLFLNPQTYETETILDGFQRTVHELLVIPETGMAYVPIFGDGIHGRNPNPGHVLHVIDLLKRKVVGGIDLSPYSAPHTVRLGADGLIYITCENSAKVAVIDQKTHKMIDAIDSGSTNGHRLAIAPDGQRLYTDNEEDATVSVIDVPKRKLLGTIKTPHALAGIAISGDGRTVVAVSDEQPMIFLIDTIAEQVMREVRLEGVRLFHDGLVKALDVKNTAAAAANIASYSGYFTGPDVYYQMFFNAPAQETVQKEVGGGVTVPSINPAKSGSLLDPTRIKSAIDRMRSSRKLTGIHGVSLGDVALYDQSGKRVARLLPDKEVRVAAGPGMVFRVSVQNQGTVTETNVPVAVTIVPPGVSAEQKRSQTLASIPAGTTRAVDVRGFIPQASSIGRVTIVKVFVGPVPDEQTTTNNKAEYKLRLTYPSG